MKNDKPKPLALAILALLYEEPMHPYRIHQLIQDRGKGEIINVPHRSNLYQTINQLVKHNLVSIHKTSKEGNSPERTIYEITDDGKRTAESWLRNMLSAPAREFPEFPAALAFLTLLTPEDAGAQLEKRAQKIKDALSEIDDRLQEASTGQSRLSGIESEYKRAMLAMELTWVRSLSEDLNNGRLDWNKK